MMSKKALALSLMDLSSVAAFSARADDKILSCGVIQNYGAQSESVDPASITVAAVNNGAATANVSYENVKLTMTLSSGNLSYLISRSDNSTESGSVSMADPNSQTFIGFENGAIVDIEKATHAFTCKLISVNIQSALLDK